MRLQESHWQLLLHFSLKRCALWPHLLFSSSNVAKVAGRCTRAPVGRQVQGSHLGHLLSGGHHAPNYRDLAHFQVALPLRGEAVTAVPPVLVAEESGRCRGVVDGDRQESGVGSSGRRDEAVDSAGDEVAEQGFMLSLLRPLPTTRLPPGEGATLAPVAPSAFM